ncbi:MAG: AAA family ATPase, partial [Kangiellaceae bacterium]|nr:AAA family ATPase [Kangiellaceae bacterium]
EEFVKDKTQQDEAAAKLGQKEFRGELATKAMPRTDFLKAKLFLADEYGNPDLAVAFQKYLVQAQWRLRAMLNKNADVDRIIPNIADVGLDGIVDALETRAQALLADDESDERKALRAELAELKDRQWFAGIKDDVLAEVGRLKSIETLTNALNRARSGTVTSKNTGLSKVLITERLRRRFAQEVDHLKLANLAIELTQAGSQQGISRFKVSLTGSKSGNTGEVLSEGEYRGVALAGFLAELATNNSDSGIIFDDPVSSLDHLHRETIAERLADEGRKRQVIVFTHDLPFLFLLRNACRQAADPSQKTKIALRHIQKKQDRPGYCRNEAPEKAQNAHSRIKTMQAHLANTLIQYEQDPDSTNWLITARGIIDSLRQTWETAVEDAISPVLRTFSSKVNTKGFAKLSAIIEEDAVTMRQHYGKCSVLLHKTSDALNPSAPTPETIKNELEAIENWLQTISDRQSLINTT